VNPIILKAISYKTVNSRPVKTMPRQKSKKMSSGSITTYLLLPFAGLLFCVPPYHNGPNFNQTGTPRNTPDRGVTKDTNAKVSSLQNKLNSAPDTGHYSPDAAASDSFRTRSQMADSAETSVDLQAGEDSLYDQAVSDLESFVWDSARIDFKRLDSLNWNDTIRIMLADSAKGKCYCHPIGGPITSNFGQRNWRWHYGTDVRLMTGDTVRSALDGIVRLVAYDRHGYGHVIVVRHADGLETLYGHLSKTIAVSNQSVKAGEALGLGGNTGHSTGPHLHFETRYYGHAFDPCHIVDFDSCRLRQDTLILTKADFQYLVELRKEKWVTICKGNTLGRIARQYHTSIAKLCSLNHITRKTILRIGRKIRYQ
jgi:murein DD-endopeptidase MepM/ murein hydrolase activator NlpD